MRRERIIVLRLTSAVDIWLGSMPVWDILVGIDVI